MKTRSVWAVVAGALVIAGCGSPPPAGSVSRSELATIRQKQASVQIGAPKAQVLESLKPGNTIRLGSSEVAGGTVEEWKLEAFYDSDSGRELTVSFLYFLNDKLVDTSDKRLDFRDNPALVARWSGKGK